MTLKQQGSIAGGVRVTRWWTGRLGVEGVIGVAPSHLWSSRSGQATPATVTRASAKAMLRVTPPAARAALYVGGGMGVVSHGGTESYPDWYGGPRTFFTGMVNVGTSVSLAGLVIRLDAEDLVYSAHVGRCTRTGGGGTVCDIWNTVTYTNTVTTPTAAVVQHDLVLSLGFVIP